MTWREIKIRALCARTRAADPRRNPEVAFRYIDISGIDRVAKRIATTAEILGADAPSRARQLVQSDDVLVSTVRPNLNAVAIVPEELDGAIASTGFCVLRTRKKVLAPRYLFYFTRTEPFVGALLQHVRGANYPAVTDRNVLDVTIPLPPPSEQRRIVEILDQADALRKKRAEADAKAARILPALFYKMFGDPATNPKGWPVQPFSKLFSQDKTAVDESAGKGLPYLGLEHIESDTGRILSSEAEGLAVDVMGLAFRFGPQHVLYGKLRPYLNKVALPSFEGRCSTELVPLLPAAGVPREFVAAYLRLPHVVNAAMATNKGARMPRTDMHLLMAMKVPIPDVDSQRAFAVVCSTVSRTTERNRDAGRCVTDLFAVLLHRAFTGNLTAEWREAHMKELLAEMEVQAKALESQDEETGDADERPRRRRGRKE